MKKIFLFLSTGRCGTQWIADTFARVYEDVADVTHEPIDAHYRPRDFLRTYERFDDMLAIDAVKRHLERVEKTIESRTYIETGWPVYAAIPLYIETFGADAVGIVRVPRHPVHVAASFVTHGFWHGRADEFATHGVLDPWAPGVAMSEYSARWKGMSAYEKCLYWWAELHLYGTELREHYPTVSFHDIKFEDLFRPGDASLPEMVSFLGLPDRGVADAIGQRVDQHRRRGGGFDWWEIFDHPKVLAVAESLGYNVKWNTASELDARYARPLSTRLRPYLWPLQWARARARAFVRR